MGRDVLVEMKAAGLCHTDMLFATHDVAPIPVVPGHEVAGIVAEVCPDVMQFDVGGHVVGCRRGRSESRSADSGSREDVGI
jgi:S-(hydroxymethyl)glutathione dehydrogenase / alcohol dehydrogenase